MSTIEQNDQKKLMLVDGHGLAYRAYHALPDTLATATGEPTNAVYGFTVMLLDVINHYQPDYVIVSFDVGKTFRHEAFVDYKAHRASMPSDLRDQMIRIHEVLDALNIPVHTREGYEADDVIGSLACMVGSDETSVLVVTGDSDLLQLVDSYTSVILPGRQRFGDFRVFDAAAVHDRYGFPPERIPDFKALVGDTSDNIPGVAGIGQKTATTLIQSYATLEEMLEHIDEIKPPRAQKSLQENFDTALQSRELATIVCDIDLDLDISTCQLTDYDRDKAVTVFRELEFRTLLNRLPEPVTHHTRPAAPIKTDRTIVTDIPTLMAMAESLKSAPGIALDVETDSQKASAANLVGIALATSPTTSYYIPIAHRSAGAQIDAGVVRDVLGPIIESGEIPLYAHNAKYDAVVMERSGYSLPRFAFDTMIAAYLLGESSLRLKELGFVRLGIEMQEITTLIGTGKKQITIDHAPVADVANYSCSDVEVTYGLVNVLSPELTEQQQDDLFYGIEMPLIDVLIEMEKTGIAVDVEYLQMLSKQLTDQIDELAQSIHQHAGTPVNINSPKQLGAILFDELGLPTGRKTKTGYSVSQDVLEALRTAHPIVDEILEYRQLIKLKNTYVDSLPAQVNPETGRIHTSFNQTVAATGRLSSSDPNLQNIPVRTGIGRGVRRSFIADNRSGGAPFDEPAVFLSADYSQVELRLMAHFSNDDTLLRAFQAGHDIHAATAADVYGIPIEDVTSDMRRIAKAVNFGIMYGMQAFGLARDTGMSRSEAQSFIDTYFERLSGVREYLDKTKELARNQGYVSTLFGRRRYVPDMESSNFNRRTAAERMATNMPLQGTAADIIKVAMIQVQKELVNRGMRSRMLLQVHDELLFEAPRSEVEPLAEFVTQIMENITELKVPLVAELAVGGNWDDLEPM